MLRSEGDRRTFKPANQENVVRRSFSPSAGPMSETRWSEAISSAPLPIPDERTAVDAACDWSLAHGLVSALPLSV